MGPLGVQREKLAVCGHPPPGPDTSSSPGSNIIRGLLHSNIPGTDTGGPYEQGPAVLDEA